ncbi:autophagy-related protein [Vararia minispora EC-137]|uniref:Autophagy-related protein n=1 Tax=Vararia minispora EC-137 TaxID=1314806 RepID=A0ACB8QRJ9_9AGAM|nr:autophagy-related protein [Vararia minispora EC-137]
MNTITIDIVLDRLNTREVLRALLHSILFHRLFGTIKPQTFEILDVTMPGVSDPEMERLVEDKVAAFWKAMENGANKRGSITVTLSGKQQRKTWIGYTYEEEVPWEQWVINVEIRQPKTEPERSKFNQNLAATLTKSLTTMLTHTASEKGRAAVPPITNQDVSPFPLNISVTVGDVEVG